MIIKKNVYSNVYAPHSFLPIMKMPHILSIYRRISVGCKDNLFFIFALQTVM